MSNDAQFAGGRHEVWINSRVCSDLNNYLLGFKCHWINAYKFPASPWIIYRFNHHVSFNFCNPLSIRKLPNNRREEFSIGFNTAGNIAYFIVWG